MVDKMTTSVLYIDSRYRQSHETFDTFVCRPKLNQKKKFGKIRLSAASIPLSGYQFRSGISNVFQVQESAGVAQNVTITEGNYATDTFGTTLKTLLDATTLAGTFTVTFSENTGKLTISSTVAFRLIWTQPELAYMFGFSSTTTAYALTHTGSFCFNLTSPPFLFVNLSGLGTRVDTQESHNLSSTFIVRTGNITGLDIAQNDSTEWYHLPNGLPDTFQVSLLRPDGSSYNPNADWSIVLFVQ